MDRSRGWSLAVTDGSAGRRVVPRALRGWSPCATATATMTSGAITRLRESDDDRGDRQAGQPVTP
jgi:hypothetical protein